MTEFMIGLLFGAGIMAIVVMISLTKEEKENEADRMAWKATKNTNPVTYSLPEIMRELGMGD
mgnify:CR=1 FL=1